MNQDGRRALKKLREEGYKIDDEEYRKWWKEKEHYYNSNGSNLWSKVTVKQIMDWWKMDKVIRWV